jgi:hypothetical protein
MIEEHGVGWAIQKPTTVGGWMRPTSGLRASGCIYTGLWTPAVRRSTSPSVVAKRDVAAAERFLAKALGGENHPAPRSSIPTHAGYPPAIAEFVLTVFLDENSKHRPVQYLNNILNRSPGHQTPGARKSTFSFVWGAWRNDRRL